MNSEYYHRHRNKYLPDDLKYIFILESPPVSGLYFYDENGKTSEPLFMEMMKLFGIKAKDKKEGLKQFQKAGYVIVDATYKPVNHLKGQKRNEVILNDFALLLEDLKKINADKKVPLVLVKANICRLLEPLLKQEDFLIKNNGVVVPFPSSGQQKRFREEISKLQINTKYIASMG